MNGSLHQKIMIAFLAVLVALVSYQTWVLRKITSLNHPKISGWHTIQEYQRFISEDPFSAFVWAQMSLNEKRAQLMLQAYQVRLLEKICSYLQEKADTGTKETFLPVNTTPLPDRTPDSPDI